jgi:hypothetical protein
MLSIPVILTGIATTNPLITISGAALTGISQFTDQLIKLLSSRYSWIGFLSKETELHKK